MDSVLAFLNQLLVKDDVIVVGVSTGPDSMALLHLFEVIRKKKNIKIIVAHVNHHLRKQSDEEYIFIEDYCQKHDLTFEGMVIDKYGDDNFHNEARNIRYKFYESLINKYQAKYLMTGHHGDDLIETILMRIVRGSTLQGYSGFKQVVDRKNYKIIRPLLFVTKDDLLKYDEENKVPYYIDQSNFKDVYTRNRYRKNVLPFLKEEDKLVHLKFLKYSKTLQEYDGFINKILNSVIDEVYQDGIIKINEFLKQDLFMQKRIIDYLLEKIYHDDLFEIDDRHVDIILKTINSHKASLSCNLPNDYLIVKDYDKAYFKKVIDSITSYDIELNDEVLLPNGMKIEKINESNTDGNDILRLNSKDILLPLRVRNRHNGDKMTIKNMNGLKKVSDIFVNSKISKNKRDSWPIVVDSNDKIVWIPKVKKSKYNRRKEEVCDIIYKCS